MKTYTFVCGNVKVVLEAWEMEAALCELEKRLDHASSFGVQLPSWLDFETESVVEGA